MDIVVYIDDTRMVGEFYESNESDSSGTFETLGGKEYSLFTDSETAGQEAREYWKDMVEHDSSEFICIVGEDTLVKWALGEYAGPGSVSVNSLANWLDLWLDTPEEHYASYDGLECIFSSKHPDVSNYMVAYRTN